MIGAAADYRSADLSLTIARVTSTSQIETARFLARSIWFAHYPGIISWAQVHYMLERDYTAEAIASEIGAGVQWCIVTRHGTPVGFCAYKERSREVSVEKLYVEGDVRRLGIGRACVEHAEHWARERRLDALVLTVNKRNLVAVRAYLAMGFSFVGALVKDIGAGFVMDDYVMRRFVT
jgi:ribosomal protein S18 acetylase RimI-like enzyme